jgi:hypothetical protein
MPLSPISFANWDSVLYYLLVLYYLQEQDVKSWLERK